MGHHKKTQEKPFERAGRVALDNFTLIFCVAALAVCLFYCFFTGQIWEDFFITFKFSQNIYEGGGMVYNDGVKVHGFTSPLGTLLPALCCCLQGSGDYSGALWLFRLIFCIPAFIAGGVFFIRLFSGPGARVSLPGAFMGIFYLFQAKGVMFSLNGMETALMLFFLGWAFFIVRRGAAERWISLGCACAGLQWTRPDSFIYIAALFAGALIFSGKEGRPGLFKALIKAGLLSVTLYLPWLLWAWLYYGSPLPHTITAKSKLEPFLGVWPLALKICGGLFKTAAEIFAPPYINFRSWPPLVHLLCGALGCFGLLYFLCFFVRDFLGKTASFVFFAACVYLAGIPRLYPWYAPPAETLGWLALAAGTSSLAGVLSGVKSRPRLIVLILAPFAVFLALSFAMITFYSKVQQEIVEDGTRRQIGEWLRGVIKPGERVYLECLGYIGYFSGAHMLDYPGLASPEVARLLREPGMNFARAAAELKPEWIVLRYYECLAMANSGALDNYRCVREFNSLPETEKHAYIPGESNLYYDAVFFVFKRKDLCEGDQ